MVCRFALVMLAACGRLGFDDLHDGGIVDGDISPNRVFITKDTWTADLGGLAGADAKCQTAADDAGLGGEFIAFLWTTGTDPTRRLAGARGWVDLTGQVIADEATEFVAGGQRAPVHYDEYGTLLTEQNAWFGGNTQTCEDWTVATAIGAIFLNSDTINSQQNNLNSSCTSSVHLMCAERAHNTVLVPPIESGRIAFVAEYWAVGSGIADADARCNSDAAAAGLPGTYLAWLGTSGGGPETRFTDGAPWRRVDGVRLAATAMDFLSTTTPSYLTSFLNRTADGRITTQLAFTGVSGNTCGDWMNTSPLVSVGIPGSSLRADFRLTPYQAPCYVPGSIVCLQQ